MNPPYKPLVTSQYARPAGRFFAGSALAGVLLLGGCSSLVPKPMPLDAAELAGVNRADTARMRADVAPLTAPLTLEEAIARALKYNLERRAKMMEEALQLNQLDVTQYDMLPRLVAQAGYSHRNNDRINISRDVITGEPSTTQFISQDRAHHFGDLGFTWSLLDLGLGYYGARQQADRVLIASERRRKAMHLLVQDVRTAFWRATSAQKLQAQVQGTIATAEEALADSRKVERERVRNPIDALRYQRQLLENLRLLEAVAQELSSAQVELASLINAPLGRPLAIAEVPIPGAEPGVLQLPMGVLEDAALEQNADLREQHYNTRIARQETQKAMLRMFPYLSFSYALKYDSDSYLVNQRWNEAGLQLSFNLMNLLTGPAQIKLAEAGISLSEQRRMAMQMSVLAQVHLARLQLQNARSQFLRADEIYGADQKISELTRAREAAQVQSKLDRVGNDTATILSLLRRYQALAQVQKSESQLLATLGLEPRIGSTSELSLTELTEQVTRQGDPWAALRGRVPSAPAAPPAGGAK
jgi:outer membrane protein TolC